MGRAFEYRKAAKMKRWGHMARTFTKIGKQIDIAVKAGGPEPENNPTLRAIIANAKRENMPKDNIERAIKNAMGKDQSEYKVVTYEGYGPHGVAIFVDTLTDNTTRTVGDVRSVFNKFNGNLGTSGSLSFLFDHKSVFTFKKKDGLEMDELILDLIDYGVEDEFDEEDVADIRQLSRHTYAVRALTDIDDFNQQFNTQFVDEEVDTIGGLIMQAFGYLPKRGEEITLENLHFKVTSADSRRAFLTRAVYFIQ